ncbi:endo-1,4-beta-xylanase [Paenibacillus daejeonensis]|uniref:endo-1,4-beta-xylanase n=1 Tax=Paenibacillus daejeonensis TaxID=135193 RepID=UPI00037BD9EF|nr:endo-1,4-beta-xylanase [Paenibacillus daejeonensis]
MNKSSKRRLAILSAAAAVVVILAVIALRPETEPPAKDDTEITEESSVPEGETAGAEPVSAEPLPVSEEAEEPEPAEQIAPEELRSLADAYTASFPIGAAIEPFQTEGPTAELLKQHVNYLVAENAMKPASLQPVEGQFRFEPADRIVAFARENGMALRFHTLVWHNQSPDWFFLDENWQPMAEETDEAKREANKQLVLERLETHVRTVVERYKDDIVSWDVVNEVIEPGDPDGMRASLWYELTGTDYIATAFRAAREAGGPDIRLYINDYNTNELRKRDRLHELVQSLLADGVPIDGVGHQTHINYRWPSVDSIITSMQMFAELGLVNEVTELDMSVYEYQDRSDLGLPIPEDRLEAQAQRYGELFRALQEHSDIIDGVVFWGIADNHTWLNGFPVERTDAPMPFDRELQPKPAYWAILEASQS